MDKTDNSMSPPFFVICTTLLESFSINKRFAVSCDSTAAIPSEVLNVEKTIASTLTFADGLVMITESPGKKAAAFIYNPGGSSPEAATNALPSKDGFEADVNSTTAAIHTALSIICFFILLLPSRRNDVSQFQYPNRVLRQNA